MSKNKISNGIVGAVGEPGVDIRLHGQSKGFLEGYELGLRDGKLSGYYDGVKDQYDNHVHEKFLEEVRAESERPGVE